MLLIRFSFASFIKCAWCSYSSYYSRLISCIRGPILCFGVPGKPPPRGPPKTRDVCVQAGGTDKQKTQASFKTTWGEAWLLFFARKPQQWVIKGFETEHAWSLYNSDASIRANCGVCRSCTYIYIFICRYRSKASDRVCTQPIITRYLVSPWPAIQATFEVFVWLIFPASVAYHNELLIPIPIWTMKRFWNPKYKPTKQRRSARYGPTTVVQRAPGLNPIGTALRIWGHIFLELL